MTPSEFKAWNENKRRCFKRLVVMMQNPEKLVATVQISGMFANVMLVALVAYATVALREQSMLTINLFVLCVLVLCILIAVYFAYKHMQKKSIKVLARLSLMWAILKIALYPFTVALLWYTKSRQSKSINELSTVLEKNSEISENENILKGIVKFGNIDVHTIMTSRMDVESVDVNADLGELFAKINEWGYSRIPVYDDSPDVIKGILYVKDLLPHIDAPSNFQWQELIRNAYFVPENKKIAVLLKEFQELKIHLAVIINEYGSMLGIVTLEDILEEIVGDIADELDNDELAYTKIDENNYLFDGKVLLNDYFRIMHLEESDFAAIRGEADTLAGLILEIKGEFPKKGDCVEFLNIVFCVESVENRRIKQIKVTIHE